MKELAEHFLPREITEVLIAWYRKNCRALPWRSDPPDPYRVWLSEIMLQQTRIEAVKGYFTRFLAAAPDLASLAQLPEEKVLKLWQGLGYYSRAGNLLAAARKIMAEHHGIFPGTERELCKLPGIGSYTAGAIASIAFDRPVPAVDGNVVRLAVRLTAFRGDPRTPGFREELEKQLVPLYPGEGANGIFTQALMELGETVCLPHGEPLCGCCPLAELCRANREGCAGELPLKTGRKSVPEEKHTVFLLDCGGKTAFRRRPPQGLLAHLWELPNVPGHLTPEEAAVWLEKQGISAVHLRAGRAARHRFTHKIWDMISYCGVCVPMGRNDWEWLERQQPALPSAFGYFIDPPDGEENKCAKR